MCILYVTYFIYKKRGRYDRISNIARTGWLGRDRVFGEIFVSAEIIRFIRDPKQRRKLENCRIIALRSTMQPDDLVMDHVDTSACERDWLKPLGTQTTNG